MDFLHHHHLPAMVLSVLRLGVWLLILSVIFLPLERLFAVRKEPLLRRSMLGDLGFYFISGVIPHLLLILPLSVAAYAAYRFVPLRWHAEVETWPLWLRGLSAFVVADLGFYWGHRLTHEIPFLWRFHALHHDPKHVYFLIGARAHPIDNMVIRLCGLVPIYILGLGAPQSVQGTMVATVIMLLVTVWGYFIHANLRWRFGPFEWLLATPAFHHWHHTAGEIRDRNFASMLPCWDWMFGTLHLPKSWPEAYGIDEPLPASVAEQLLHPFRLKSKPAQLAPAGNAAQG